jgi:hypothetical protein
MQPFDQFPREGHEIDPIGAVIRAYDEGSNVIEKVSSRGLAHFHHRSNVRSTNDTKSASSAGKG